MIWVIAYSNLIELLKPVNLSFAVREAGAFKCLTNFILVLDTRDDVPNNRRSKDSLDGGCK